MADALVFIHKLQTFLFVFSTILLGTFAPTALVGLLFLCVIGLHLAVFLKCTCDLVFCVDERSPTYDYD